MQGNLLNSLQVHYVSLLVPSHRVDLLVKEDM